MNVHFNTNVTPLLFVIEAMKNTLEKGKERELPAEFYRIDSVYDHEAGALVSTIYPSDDLLVFAGESLCPI